MTKESQILVLKKKTKYAYLKFIFLEKTTTSTKKHLHKVDSHSKKLFMSLKKNSALQIRS